MSSSPKVSIITVVFNDVSHIEETLLSVLNQTYPNVEYIVIDGGSTDGTVEIIKKYARRLAYWVTESDGGIYPAMNKGMRHAAGEWVNFMNSGDTFVDNNVLASIFSNTVVLTDKRIIGGHTYRVYSNHVEEWKAMPADVIPAFIPYCHQSTFVRINQDYPWIFDEKYRIAADYKVLYDHFYRFGKNAFFNVDRFVANYRMEDSTTFQNQKKAKREYLSIQAKHPSWFWLKELIKSYTL